MPIDVIICTYNRPEKVASLVEQILQCKPAPNRVIVVDSSDNDHETLACRSDITYVKSDRKSQPYQRYLGTKHSQAPIVCFFDDDVNILISTLFADIKAAFNDPAVVGVSAGIHYENGVPLNQQTTEKLLQHTGKITWLGKTTGLPQQNQEVEYFPGPIMSFRTEILPQVFDEYLFTIFEKRMAMGEDKAISMRASKYGKLMYLGAKNYLYHPPEPSTYFTNNINFIAKTTFSRLWLNKIIADIKQQPQWKAYAIFAMYVTKQCIKGLTQKEVLKGNILALQWLIKN